MSGTIDQIQDLIHQIMEEYPDQIRIQTLCKGMLSLCRMIKNA